MNSFGKIAARVVLALFLYMHSYAQPPNIEQLRALIREKQTKKDFFKDTSYINALNNLAFSYNRVSADSVLVYANKALEYAKKAGYGRGESNALRQLGNGYALLGNLTDMLSFFNQALAVAEKIDDHQLIAQASVNIAMQYSKMGKYKEALVMAERARPLFEETRDSMNLNKTITAIGGIWYEQGQVDKALPYYQQALQLARAMKNEYLLETNNDVFGAILIQKGRYEEGLACFLHSMDYFKRTNDKMRTSRTAEAIAEAYFGLKRYPESLKYGLQSLQLASDLKGKYAMRQACAVLVNTYAAKGDYRNEAKYLRMYSDLSDTLYNEQMLKNTAKLEAKYEYEKKEIGLRGEQAKKDVLNRDIVRIKELEMFFAIVVIVILGALAFVQFRSRTAKQKANQVLEAKNTEIGRQKEEIETQSLLLLINNQQKDKLFNIIAHDLKAPLHSLNVVLDLLKARALSEAQINIMLEELRRDVDYSAGLIRNLLFWARSQLNGLVIKPVELNLQLLAGDVYSLFIKQAADKKVLLRNELDPALQGYADNDMTHLILRNLVSNAVKFCRPGDTITIDGKTTEDGVEICVADTGIGITENNLEIINARRIVTTFGTAEEQGTGLGILLCREFVELNNGRFHIESIAGAGSRFFFTIPQVSLTG